MFFDIRAWFLLMVMGGVACGGGQKSAESAEDDQGPAERAGRTLDEAAHDIHEKGDEVGQEVDESFSEAGRDVKKKIGDDPHAPAPKNDGGE